MIFIGFFDICNFLLLKIDSHLCGVKLYPLSHVLHHKLSPNLKVFHSLLKSQSYLNVTQNFKSTSETSGLLLLNTLWGQL